LPGGQEELNNDGYNQQWSGQDLGENEYQNNGGMGAGMVNMWPVQQQWPQ
jgi:hypothetical protein